MRLARRLTFGVLCHVIHTVIRSFRCEGTQKIFARQRSRKLPQGIQQVVLRKHRMLNHAMTLSALRVPPANRLEKLRGDRASQHSIRINDQRRITADTTFAWHVSLVLAGLADGL